MSTKKQMRELRALGYEVALTHKAHIKITHPTKPGVVFTGSTPSDRRTGDNLQRDLRRVFGRSEQQ